MNGIFFIVSSKIWTVERCVNRMKENAYLCKKAGKLCAA